jgi:hypothetical protein
MTVAANAILAVVLVACSATAHADCDDAGQDPCMGPVPTVDEVVAVLGGLTDPDIPAASKTNIVTPGFTPDEAETIDNHLTRMKVFGGLLPLPYAVRDIQPAPNNVAGATVNILGGYRQNTGSRPIVLVEQGGRWLLDHDAAMNEMNAIWQTAERGGPGFVK